MATKIVNIPNISCQHCTRTIEQEMKELTGVKSVNAEVTSKMVTIEWDEPPATWSLIVGKLKEIGYPAQP